MCAEISGTSQLPSALTGHEGAQIMGGKAAIPPGRLNELARMREQAPSVEIAPRFAPTV